MASSITKTGSPNLYRAKVWLIGGSEGIGLELCKALLKSNYQLIVSSRDCENSASIEELIHQYPVQLNCLDLDVKDTNSLKDKVIQAWQQLDGIDIWFYNAGAYKPMTIDEWELKSFQDMNEVNYLGAVKLMLELKNLFLEQGHGRWIWNISLASDFGLPYGGGYSAPKAALLNLAESLQPELKTHNIDLQVINHGFVKTRLTAKNDFAMLGLMTAEQAAARIMRVFDNKHFETRFPFNLSTLLGTIKRLPKSWALAITKKMLR